MAVGNNRETFSKISFFEVEDCFFAKRYILREKVVEIVVDS
jgi:hypothetical protein